MCRVCTCHHAAADDSRQCAPCMLTELADVPLQLLPCVRLPQMGLPMLLVSVEQDTWLMSLDVTKVRGRHSHCTLVC